MNPHTPSHLYPHAHTQCRHFLIQHVCAQNPHTYVHMHAHSHTHTHPCIDPHTSPKHHTPTSTHSYNLPTQTYTWKHMCISICTHTQAHAHIPSRTCTSHTHTHTHPSAVYDWPWTHMRHIPSSDVAVHGRGSCPSWAGSWYMWFGPTPRPRSSSPQLRSTHVKEQEAGTARSVSFLHTQALHCDWVTGLAWGFKPTFTSYPHCHLQGTQATSSCQLAGMPCPRLPW